MSRIQQTLDILKKQNRKGLIPFVTAGFPEPEQTVELMHAMVDGGADIIELGVPFSDPMADGPVIQHATEVALEKGMNLNKVLDMVEQFRKKDATTPVVLMGYANPIERMGVDVFVERASRQGVDGVLVVDYPPEEGDAFARQLKAAGMDMIFLLAPTSTDERIRKVGQMASGYIYYVSLKGVTGAGNLDVAEVTARIEKIRKYVTIPIGVGFGIRDAATARMLGSVADAVVIGSRIIQKLDEAEPENALQAVREFLTDIRKALDE